MKNLKTTILSAFIAFSCLTNGIAQEAARGKSKGKVVMTGRPGSIVVFGGGTSMPSSDGKDKAFLSNSTAINADVFFSLISKPEANSSFGLNFGGVYNFGGSGGNAPTAKLFSVTAEVQSVLSDKGGSPAQAEFRMGAGPQANFYFGKFIVSPMVLGEYFSMTQKEMSIVQTTEYNGQSYDFNLATLPETKTSGFAVTPKLRLHYMFNDRFGLFADASYTMGPKMETTVSKLIPNGNPSPQSNSYNIQQLETGTMVKGETKSTAYSAMGFNFGVVIGLGRNGSKGWNGVAETAQSNDASKTSASCSCIVGQTGWVQFPSGSGSSANIESTLNIPYDASNISKNLTIVYNPHPGSTLYTGIYNTRIKVLINGNDSFGIVNRTNPTGTTNNYTLTSASGAMVVSFNELLTGINTIKIIGYCGSTECVLGTVTVNVDAPPAPSSGTITLVKECCSETDRIPPYATHYTGQVKFKMAGTVVNAVLEINSPSGVVHEPFVNGGTTACYSKPMTIQLVSNSTYTPIVGSSINGFPTATVTGFRFECFRVKDISIKSDFSSVSHTLLPEGPGRNIDLDSAVTWTLDDFNGFRLNGSGKGKDGGKIDMSCPVGIDEETGKMFLTGTPEITKTVNGKTSKIKSDYKPTQKRDYVGHVTLLK